MDAKMLLDELLGQGNDLLQRAREQSAEMIENAGLGERLEQAKGYVKDSASRAEDYAAGKLGVSDDPEARAKMLKGIGGGAAAGALLALMLGTRTGRGVSGAALKVGSLAALGTLGYKAWQKYAGQVPEGAPVTELSEAAAGRRAEKLVRAMIAAAKADGAISDQEHEVIDAEIAQNDGLRFIADELDMVPDPEAVAALAENDQEKAEIYAASCIVLRQTNANEEAYLEALRRALGLSRGMAGDIRDGVSED